jgi:DNA helicase HerA-like ATPase
MLSTDQRREHGHPDIAAPLGRVISVRGSQTNVGLAAASVSDPEETRVTVGKFVGIRAGRSLLVGVVTDVLLNTQQPAGERGFSAIASLDIVGEIQDHDQPSARFQRGVTTYPVIGDPATLVGSHQLSLVFNLSGPAVIEVGHLQLDDAIGAYVNANDMLSKHFAVLGSTGVGKSSGVALILQQVLQARPDLRIFVLDAHNEYGRCFGKRAEVISPRNLKLPFWMFNFEEIVDVFFGGRPGLQEEVEILSEVIPLAKAAYTQYRGPVDRPSIKKGDPRGTAYTVDNPVPYRMADLVSLLDARMGKLENRSSRLLYHRLISRIETVCNDPRYAFMFENANVGGDTMAEVFSYIFRLPPDGVPMTVLQLAGFPAEVVDAVVSVLCRMAFDFALWSDGAAPLLVVCEEAHRYVAADRAVGFGPTRRSISRIAKEGRKYGIFLGLVTQRPAELDPTILSQCSTLFVMRMTNDRDQAIVRSAVSDAAANLLAFLPSLGTREVFAFGEGVALPTRLKFTQLPPHLIPRSEAVKDDYVASDISLDFVASVLDRWRGAMTTQKLASDEAPSIRPSAEAAALPPRPGSGLDPDRFKLLKRSPLERADSDADAQLYPGTQPSRRPPG